MARELAKECEKKIGWRLMPEFVLSKRIPVLSKRGFANICSNMRYSVV